MSDSVQPFPLGAYVIGDGPDHRRHGVVIGCSDDGTTLTLSTPYGDVAVDVVGAEILDGEPVGAMRLHVDRVRYLLAHPHTDEED